MVRNILSGNFILKQVIDGKAEARIEVTGRRVRRRKQPPHNHKKKRVLLEIERRITRPRCAENSICKRLWTCLKRD